MRIWFTWSIQIRKASGYIDDVFYYFILSNVIFSEPTVQTWFNYGWIK